MGVSMTDKRNAILNFVRENIRCSDGAMGTQLMNKGLKSGECPELASEAALKAVHREYLEAGAQILTTNTFGGTAIKLKNYGLASKALEINERNTALAREIAAGNECFVAGDIGPTGEFIEPFGTMSFEEFHEAFSEQIQGLVKGGADLLIIETMMDLHEAKAAVKASKEHSDLAVIACMTFNKTPQGFRSLTGVDPVTAAKELEAAGADIIGSNCSLVPAEMAELIAVLRQATTLPVIATPNAGQPIVVNGEFTYKLSDTVEKDIETIVRNGANIVGGCCGTTPDFIRMTRGIIDRINKG